MATVFHAWLYGRYRATSGEGNFIEWILEAILAIETMSGPQSNLEEKFKPSILKDDFSQEQSHSFLHQ